MKPFVLSLLILSAASTAHSAPDDLSAYHGSAHCRIAPLLPAPRNGVSWSGPCKDGFAEGEGMLEWHSSNKGRYKLKGKAVRGAIQGDTALDNRWYTYKGSVQHGIPHGAGFFIFPNGAMYEGEIAHGRAEGQGTWLATDRSQYTGQWKDGERHGKGEMVYTAGGSYTGEWKAGKRHGYGIAVFAGSGRKYEGLFENGWVAGSRAAAASAADTDAPALAKGSWDELSETARDEARSAYPMLEPGDDPPYPLKGRQETIAAIHEINQQLGPMRGKLRVHVLVGADGKAKSVKLFERPQYYDAKDRQAQTRVDLLIQNLGKVLMVDSYKPAMCRRQACDMVYTLRYHFIIDDEKPDSEEYDKWGLELP